MALTFLLTAAMMALTFLAIGLERPVLIASALHPSVRPFSDGRHPGSVVCGGGGADILAPPPPPAAFSSSSPALRGDSSGTPGVQILTGWPPNNAGLAADAATKLTILEEIGRKRERKNRVGWKRVYMQIRWLFP